jgi:flavodoxin
MRADSTTTKLIKQFSWQNAELEDKVVILRCNLDEDSLKNTAEFVSLLKDQKPRSLVLIAHRGEPQAANPEFTLKPISARLQELLDTKVDFAPADINSIRELVERRAEIILVENTRFFAEEDSRDPIKRDNFALRLAELADIFIFDLVTDYKESATSYDLAKYIPSYLGKNFLNSDTKTGADIIFDQLNNSERLNNFKLSNKVVTEDKNSSNKSITVIYATGSGNAELIAQSVVQGIIDAGIESTLHRAEQFPLDKITERRKLVLICSTWNVGQLQDYMIPLYNHMSKLKLPQHQIAVIGLGDSANYDIFCGAAGLLEALVEKTGARQVGETVRVDGPPHAKLDEFRLWGKNIAAEFSL